MSDLIMSLIDEKDPFLTEVPEYFDFDSPHEDPDKLEQRLIDNMKYHNGIGLSANQIETFQYAAFAMITDGELMVVFNPEIVEWSENITYEKEGCLSFPYLFMPVQRQETIGARFQLKDEMTSLEPLVVYFGIFQHEMEHMEGELFIDSIGLQTEIRNEERKILKRKVEGDKEMPRKEVLKKPEILSISYSHL